MTEIHMSSLVRWVLSIALIATILPLFITLSLPYPYDYLAINELPSYYAKNSAFNAATLTPEEYANDHLIPVLELSESTTTRLFAGIVHGAESVAMLERPYTSPHKELIMLDKYGFVHIAPCDDQTKSYHLSNTSIYTGPGRILGFHMLSSDKMIACDSLLGLISVDINDFEDCPGKGDRIRILTNAVSSSSWHSANAINYANDLDISNQDGNNMIYFSSSTTNGVVSFNTEHRFYDTMRSFLLTFLAGDISGRLLVFNMTSRKTEVLMENIYYANGVALAADNSFVLVVETVGLRVWKYHLSGSKRGQKEVFIENLPGFPDGITRSIDGDSFFVTLVAPLSPIFSKGLRIMQSPFVRWFSAWVMVTYSSLLTDLGVLKSFGCVLKIDAMSGKVGTMLLDPKGSTISTISSVTDTSDHLIFGNLAGDSIFTWKKPKSF